MCVHLVSCRAHLEALERLKALRIAVANDTHWLLSPSFRVGLRTALSGGGKSWAGADPLEPDAHAKDISELEQYSRARWEAVLQFMAAANTEGVTQEVVNVLIDAELISLSTTGEGAGRPVITNKGFQFLLQDVATQVWYFLTQYLNSLQKRGADPVEALALLFRLSFSTVGMDYPVEGLTEGQLDLLQHLREIGLVFRRKRTSRRFYPTPLAINLASGSAKNLDAADVKGYIVVETNFRIYAYTDSPLQLALLSLFVDLRYRFPNMVCGLLSRDSVRKALVKGLTAEQMIRFLRTHAHPQMRSRTPVLPETISDQLRLWELERNRLRVLPAVLYERFSNQREHDLLHHYGRDLGVELAHSSQHIVVTFEGHEQIKTFWQAHRQQAEADAQARQRAYEQQVAQHQASTMQP
ncbi:transcription factor tfb2 [Capsaspora owczarzaki ATCC 30864]|uniref:General transcription factor IIH subunit 4 n=1 Tax=Capsaspora owczarzaki (strain ATCC 30864) TaxID=595528 RepID=A0A0D2WLY0_CAPO3|nr:transcription factor tfb2 [Capsaspora owczarzaki ATCC 30864]KJE91028.1 transcription factor tfb2 [Capsaspora owczarzaki ATCC 30864]|eukprot:XP_004348981.2 transcription factor tfb2 [Capsaspora owczarzaki ATCC 30864]